MTDLNQDEFCARFTARMVSVAPGDRDEIAKYAEQIAPTYFAEPDQREEGPEACADADISYWED